MDQKSHHQNYNNININFHIAGTPYQHAAGSFNQVSTISRGQHQSQCQQVPPGSTQQQVLLQPGPMQYGSSSHHINQQLQYQLGQGVRHPPPASQEQHQQQQQNMALQHQPSYEHMFHAQPANKEPQLHNVPQGSQQPSPSKDKEIDNIRAAHQEEVNKLQERIMQLEREKDEKEKLYERIQRRIRTDQQQAIVPESDDDANGEPTFCPSPGARSNSPVSSIKEEPVETPPQPEGDIKTKETTITAKRELVGMEVSASETDGSQQTSCNKQPTDFTQCIICQKLTDENLQNLLTDEGVNSFRKIVISRDDDFGKRLLNEILDTEMFLKKEPKYHVKCRQDLNLENNRSSLVETNFSQCIICQKNSGEKLYNVTEKGFTTIQYAVSNRNDLTAKRLAVYVHSQDVFLSFFPKIHRRCRKYVNRKRVLRSMNKRESKRNSVMKEEDEDIIDPETGRHLSGEEMMDLIRQHKNNEKSSTNVTEMGNFNYGNTCFICRKTRSKIGKEKYIPLDKEKYDTVKKKAEDLSDNNILTILNSKNESERKLKYHKTCCKTYLDKPVRKMNLYNLPYDIAFTCLIKQIEEPLFKEGKGFDVSELRNEYRHYLSEQGVKSTIKAFKLSDKLKRYYTVPPKRCLVKIHTEVAQSSVVYSKHLSEEELQLEIQRLKWCRSSYDYEEANKSENEEAEQNGVADTTENQQALQGMIGENVIASGSNTTITIDKVFTKYKKKVKPKEPGQEYTCSECPFKSIHERGLLMHMKKHQRELENPKGGVMCDECGKIFHSKEACNRHKLTHGSKNFLCSHCGREFYDKYSLRKHVLTHTAEKKFECTLCDMKFITRFYLKKHLLIHTDEKPLMCTICGYSCRQKDRLKDHMSKHSDERPYVCNICGKSFKFRQPLRTHMLLHGEKPCKCPECDFRCYTKGNLKSHMRKHTGEKVYKEKVYKTQPENTLRQIKPINLNPEMGSDSVNIESNSCNTLYSYPVSTQDPRLYFPATRHFPHIPTYLFSNAQSGDPQ